MKIIQLGKAKLRLDELGRIAAITADAGDRVDGIELMYDKAEPLFRLFTSHGLLEPISLSASAQDDLLCFSFEQGYLLTVVVVQKSGYSAFKIIKVELPTKTKGEIFHVIVGPVFTRLCDTIGDVVGVVQGNGLALGIQALNSYTVPGFPRECQTSPLIDEAAVISTLSVATLLYNDCAAFPIENGSVLQLFCENRVRARTRSIMGIKGVAVPPMSPLPDFDGGVVGMEFALFCCESDQALNRIGEIEIAEGLPHPTLDGEWVKTSRKAMASYLITEFGTQNIEKLLSYTKKAGLKTLYHPEPFENWGHFDLLKKFFENGDSSMKECCDKAAAMGIRLGLHTLTSFTTSNDPYITPIPDKGLAILGEQPLLCDISADATELTLADIDEENQIFKAITTFQAVWIDNELIQYQAFEGGRLIGCTRGAFGTAASAHSKGSGVRLLCDYPYKVFFPDIHLQDSYTDRIASLFRNTGLCQISFDGLEGCTYTGEDSYAINRFCMQCYEGFENPEVINDASRLHHNLWHMNTRMNWGEPWGASMREGQTASRMINQEFYRRNLFPRMLGWFLIRKANRKFEATSVADLEWALSMAAGFDAGFALSVSEEVLDSLGCTDILLEAVKNWEALRMANAFSTELQEKLRDTKSEWHLEKESEGEAYRLYPMAISDPLVCDLLEMQPGQPGGSDWTYENPFTEQQYHLQMHVFGNGEIINPALRTPKGIIKFPCTIKGGQYLIYENGEARRTDRNYRLLEQVSPIGEAVVAAGRQPVTFSCDFAGEEGPEVTAKLFTYGEPIILTL